MRLIELEKKSQSKFELHKLQRLSPVNGINQTFSMPYHPSLARTMSPIPIPVKHQITIRHESTEKPTEMDRDQIENLIKSEIKKKQLERASTFYPIQNMKRSAFKSDRTIDVQQV